MNALVPYPTQEFVSPTIEYQSVPYNLLPNDSKSLTNEWAEKTFRYAYLFGKEFNCVDWSDPSNLQAWINMALKLQQDLRELGVQRAHEKVVLVFREYNITIPNSKQLPTNMDDIISIINDRVWYTTDQEHKQQLIHMVMYGIFRRGYNHWAVKACKEWLNERHLKLNNTDINDTLDERKVRRKKGFVYTNFVQRASNSIADRVQRQMMSNHGEYISVRYKKKGESNAKHSYEKKHFTSFEAYIVRPTDPLIQLMSQRDKLKKTIRENILLALRNKIEYKEIQNILNVCVWDIDGQMGKFMKIEFYTNYTLLIYFYYSIF